ncbi:MAG: hypothetical protein M1834_007962 [Cirrosporium novae-zelandiae]|nr:MAG: hypothetical protein M1834_007962 [Cirrosporium novae-zelandiae]
MTESLSIIRLQYSSCRLPPCFIMMSEGVESLLSHPYAIGLGLPFAYLAITVIYRLYFSPLSKFPGPKLAAISYWPEFYHEVIKYGRYEFEIHQMHEKYGPIIRISPEELHVSDPDFFDILFSTHQPRNKAASYCNSFPLTKATFATTDHYLHRLRRAPMNPFFSKQRILALEPSVRALLDKLCERLEEVKRSGKPVKIGDPYSCFTADVVTEYTMGEAYHYLDSPDFMPLWRQCIHTMGHLTKITRHFPWINRVISILPDSFSAWIDPSLALFVEYQRRAKKQVETIIANQNDPLYSEKALPTLFHSILQSDLPPKEKTAERLGQEVNVFAFAGTETTANVLANLTFYLLSNPEMLQKLRDELDVAYADPNAPPTFQQLEKLPYLVSPFVSILIQSLWEKYNTNKS